MTKKKKKIIGEITIVVAVMIDAVVIIKNDYV